MPRLLLILPTHTYQADAYMAAAARLDLELTVASEVDSTFSHQDSTHLLTLDLCDPGGAAESRNEPESGGPAIRPIAAQGRFDPPNIYLTDPV